MEPTIQRLEFLDQDRNLETKIQENVMDLMKALNITHRNLRVSPDFENTNETLKTVVVITCNCNFTSFYSDKDDNNIIGKFEAELRSTIRKDVIQFIIGKNIHLKSITAELNLQLTNVTLLEGQRGCIWLVYTKNETEPGNGTMTVVSTGKIYASERFEVLDETVIVCETDLGGPGPEEGGSFVLSVITIICAVISIICLIIRIILQFFISTFRNRPGKLHLQLSIAMLLAYILLLVGSFFSDIPDACTTAATLMAYGFLAAFTWMNVIAVDTWLVFRPSSAFSRSDEKEKSLIVHYVLGWGIPLLLVLLSLGMNYSDVNVDFRPEFGGSRCWYTKRYAMLVYFGVPMAISILMNIFFYIHTAISLRKAFTNEAATTQIQKSHFPIYVRLFVIMGITWIFGFISAFTDELAAQIIFAILVCLQGLFLFISFVCNKAVLSEIRKKRKESSSGNKKTRSTPHMGSGSGSNESKI